MITIDVRTSNKRYGLHTFEETTTTPRQVFESLDVPYQSAQPMLSGTVLKSEQMDTTLAALGASNGAVLSATVKGDGGSI